MGVLLFSAADGENPVRVRSCSSLVAGLPRSEERCAGERLVTERAQTIPDHYVTLGVAYDADGDTIRRAYRRAVAACHPDTHPNDPAAAELFLAVVAADNVLSDPERRRRYDSQRVAGSNSTQRQRAPSAPSQETVSEAWGALVGSAWRRATGGRGRDVAITMEISLADVAFGCTRTMDVPQPGPCSACNVEGPSRTGCARCGGVGVVLQSAPIEVTVPPGVVDGQRIRHRHLGEPGHAGKTGDLYVVIRVAEHPLLCRDKQTITCTVPVSLVEATRGGQLTVPGVAGPLVIDVPPGVQGGRRLRLRGRGLPPLNGGARGDYFVEVQLETPISITAAAAHALDALEAALTPANMPARARFRESMATLYEEA